VVPATDSITYFERVSEFHNGDIADFYRLYLAPGVHHCTGGPGADRFDMLTPLVSWVERGVAPERIVASRILVQENDKAVLFTRPLCPYPQRAVFAGTGDPAAETSFSCRAPLHLPEIPDLGNAYLR
jgi:feruloyl esterase